MKAISCCIRKILTSQGLSQLTCHPSLPLSFCSLAASHRELPASPGMCLPLALYPSLPFSLTSLPSGKCVAQAPSSFLFLLLFPIIREPVLMPPTASPLFCSLACFLKLAAPISQHVRHVCVCRPVSLLPVLSPPEGKLYKSRDFSSLVHSSPVPKAVPGTRATLNKYWLYE